MTGLTFVLPQGAAPITKPQKNSKAYHHITGLLQDHNVLKDEIGKCQPNPQGTSIYVHIKHEEALDEVANILGNVGIVKVSSNTEHNAEVNRDTQVKTSKESQKAALPEASSVMNLLTSATSMYESAASAASDSQKRKFSTRVVKLAKKSHDLAADGLTVQKKAPDSDSE